MAIVVMADVPGGNAQRDEELMRVMGTTEEPPPGVLLRLAGTAETGWRVISVWESREAFEEFRANTLEPALRQVGMPMPTFQFWPVESMRIMPAAQEVGGARQ